MRYLLAALLIALECGAQGPEKALDPIRRMLQQPGQRPAGGDALRRYVDEHPNDAEAVLLLGIYAESTADKNAEVRRSQALPQYLRAVQIRRGEGPGKPADMALALEANGHLLKKLDDEQAGLSLLAEASELRKTSLRQSRRETTFQEPVQKRGVPGLVLPKMIAKVDPEYTDEARTMRVPGVVVLDVVVDQSGEARNVELLRSAGFGLDERALAAVEKWRFEPGSLRAYAQSRALRGGAVQTLRAD